MSRLRSRWTVAVVLLIGLSVTGFRPASSQQVVGGAQAEKSSPQAIEAARKDSVRHPYTAADIDFLAGMIGHHAQAVKMASWAESHGAGPAVLVFCGRVVMAQTAEIGLMQTWLRDRNQPVPEADPRGMKMVMNGMEHIMMMPGMLSEEQMIRLDAARGVTYDRLFLNWMIQHHKGAIQMVDKLFATDGAATDEFIFKFASGVYADQNTEIDAMQKIIDALPTGSGNE